MTDEKKTGSGGPGLLAFGVMGLAIVMVLSGLVVALRTCSAVEDLSGRPAETIEAVRDLAGAFKTGTIRTEFLSYATELRSTSRLQVAEVEQIEVVSRKDSKAYFWDLLKLPDVEVEVQVPVTYTYYVDLREEWQFVLEGRTVKVIVPELRHNPPAPDISGMEVKETRSILRFDEDDVKDQVMEGLTNELDARAQKNIASLNIHATARESIEAFVSAWLAGALASYGVEDAEAYKVEVLFHHEVQGARD
jgi:hypothetical protein